MGPDESDFGDSVAPVCDEHSGQMFDPAVAGLAVDRLAGIDSREATLARLREEPGPQRIEAIVGDMAATRVGGDYSVYQKS